MTEKFRKQKKCILIIFKILRRNFKINSLNSFSYIVPEKRRIPVITSNICVVVFLINITMNNLTVAEQNSNGLLKTQCSIESEMNCSIWIVQSKIKRNQQTS